jgi:hypothetical protein
MHFIENPRIDSRNLLKNVSSMLLLVCLFLSFITSDISLVSANEFEEHNIAEGDAI